MGVRSLITPFLLQPTLWPLVVDIHRWQEAVHPGSGLKITMTPAVHWSARGLFDRLHTLWGGFHVRPGGSSDSDGKEKALSFWFAGRWVVGVLVNSTAPCIPSEVLPTTTSAISCPG
jgi:hypothetical protein